MGRHPGIALEPSLGNQVFASYSASASPALLQICATALSNIIYAKKDRVFHQSKEAKETWNCWKKCWKFSESWG